MLMSPRSREEREQRQQRRNGGDAARGRSPEAVLAGYDPWTARTEPLDQELSRRGNSPPLYVFTTHIAGVLWVRIRCFIPSPK